MPYCQQWLKWFCEAGGGAHLTKPGWSKPHTHSNPTNLALFRHKITLYRFNRGLILLQGAQMGAGGWAPPSPLTLTTDCQRSSWLTDVTQNTLQSFCNDVQSSTLNCTGRAKGGCACAYPMFSVDPRLEAWLTCKTRPSPTHVTTPKLKAFGQRMRACVWISPEWNAPLAFRLLRIGYSVPSELTRVDRVPMFLVTYFIPFPWYSEILAETFSYSSVFNGDSP